MRNFCNSGCLSGFESFAKLRDTFLTNTHKTDQDTFVFGCRFIPFHRNVANSLAVPRILRWIVDEDLHHF